MNSLDITTLLMKLGCERIKPNQNGAWMASTCPLAPWKHKGGVDKHSSFGISIHPEGESKFKCYTCGVSGPLAGDFGLLRQIRAKSKRDLGRIEGILAYVWVDIRNEPSDAQRLSKAAQVTNTSTWKRDPYTPSSTDPTGFQLTSQSVTQLEQAPPPMSESELARFTDPSPDIMNYLLTERRLTAETIKYWELKWHEGARRLAIPIRNSKGELVGISGRAHDGQRPKFLHSKGFRKDFYLYGECRLRKGEPGYLTEGFFDVMYLQQQGFNAFAIMGSYLSAIQVEKCTDLFTRIIVVPDGDEPGEEAATRIRERLGARMPVIVSPMDDGKDPDDLSDAELDALRRL